MAYKDGNEIVRFEFRIHVSILFSINQKIKRVVLMPGFRLSKQNERGQFCKIRTLVPLPGWSTSLSVDGTVGKVQRKIHFASCGVILMQP